MTFSLLAEQINNLHLLDFAPAGIYTVGEMSIPSVPRPSALARFVDWLASNSQLSKTDGRHYNYLPRSSSHSLALCRFIIEDLIQRSEVIREKAQKGRIAFGLRLLVITSPLSQVKSRYTHTNFDPNRVTQFLVAASAGLQVPFVCSETHELGEELVGSYLYKVHLYHWLESKDHGRFLTDNDI